MALYAPFGSSSELLVASGEGEGLGEAMVTEGLGEAWATEGLGEASATEGLEFLIFLAIFFGFFSSTKIGLEGEMVNFVQRKYTKPPNAPATRRVPKKMPKITWKN